MQIRAKPLAISLLVAFFLYCLLGFLVLPGIALHVINQQLTKLTTVPAQLKSVEFNPFTLELTLGKLRIGEPNEPQLAFERLHANLQIDSLWTGALHLSELTLERGNALVRIERDGTLNLSQLFSLPESQPKDSEEPSEEPSELFPLRIDNLNLITNRLRFEDLRPDNPVQVTYDALDLALENLSTLPKEQSEARLTASGPHGAQLNWQGQLSLTPLISRGSIQISDIQLETFWPYIKEQIPLELQHGGLELRSDYRLDLSQGTELLLESAQVEITPLAIQSPDEQPLLQLKALTIADASLDLSAQRIVIGTLQGQGLETWAAREKNGQLNWQQWLPTAPENDEQQAADETHSPSDAQPWQVIVNDAQLQGSHLHLVDHAPEHTVNLEVGPLDLALSNFDSLGDTPFDLQLSSRLNTDAQINVQGQAQLNPLGAELNIEGQNINLRLVQAYLTPFVRMEMRSGLLDSKLHLTVQDADTLALGVTGSAQIRQLHILDTVNERDLLKWQQLQLGDLNYRDNSLSIGSIELQKPYVRFIINPDQSTNISELLVEQPENTSASEPLAIRIGGININDGSANFADLSLRPSFATAIEQLNGQIGTLDNQQPTAAKVNLEGKVDRYAPVTIKGSLTPFAPLESLDITTTFKHVELTTLTPYSGKFAGYRIRKGRVNLDLHYRIEQGKLRADNKVLLEDLQLGERVDSPDAVDLPVRLAVALLKDTRGNIDIELPVQGDLNNPEFNVMPIVWQTLRNLLLRATQAPFKLLAGLASTGVDADLSQISFAPGSADLDDAARQRLDTLASALKERPALQLEVEGMSATEQDGPVLAEQRLEREYRQRWYKHLQEQGRQVPASPDMLEVAENDKTALLEPIYLSRMKQDIPDEWNALDRAQRQDMLREAILASWQDSALLLRQLAQRRNAAIKNYLVDQGQMEDQRIYLLDVGSTAAQPDGSVATQLQLGSR